MKQPIPLTKHSGRASRQAHADLPEGTYEREAGREGFLGPATQFHHQHPPTGWSHFDGPLKPRAFDLNKLPATNHPFEAPIILSNKDCEIRFWRVERPQHELARNADGDLLLFLHQGRGALYCDYGHLDLATGDYILLPRGTTWRFALKTHGAMIYMIEARDAAFALPDKGIMGRQAIFDPAVLDIPQIDEAFKAQYGETESVVAVKRDGVITRITYPFNPLDAVGWHGDLTPVRLNIGDIRPLMSARYHVPPTAHTTFVAPGFVVCTFRPRPLESDPGALNLPFYHSNEDFDEVLFYHDGDFISRDNIKAGMVTFHPSGFAHGPHPKAYQAAQSHERTQTEETAVMIDARHYLEVAEGARSVELPDYAQSWRELRAAAE